MGKKKSADYEKAMCDSEESENKGEEEERSSWGGKFDFIMTCVGYAVGLGNIWRFPYLCYRSGGGAFFIPYLIFLVFCGLPLFFLEVSYGQFGSQSPIMAWNISPLFRGIGMGMVLISGIVCIYYNVIVAWTIYYLFMSMRSVLPWSHCNNTWNTEYCVDASSKLNQSLGNGTFIETGRGFYNIVDVFDVNNGSMNVTMDETRHKLVKASEEFWQNHVLQITKGIHDMGSLRWPLLLCLIFAWFLVFIILCKGVKILGKVMHIAAPLPYLVLIILLGKGVMLPGAYDGICFYFLPRWEKLKSFSNTVQYLWSSTLVIAAWLCIAMEISEPRIATALRNDDRSDISLVWGDAAVQIFYSVGPGWGGLVTMSSFNKFNNNIYRDAMLVPLINCATSVFAGVVIFSVLGFMAHETGDLIDNVVTEGPGLTFVVYPEAVSRLPIAPLWAVLFFIMLFTVGLDSQFAMFETMLSAFMDAYPKLLRKRKVFITMFGCVISLLLGIPCIMQGGMYVLQIIDWYSACFSIMIIAISECLVIGWIYGADRFYDDIELMIGFRPCAWWKICWKFITPLITFVMLITSLVLMEPVKYGKKYTYPDWSIGVGWIIAAVSILPLPVVIIYDLVHAKGTLMERFRSTSRPNEHWGPLLKENRDIYNKMIATKSYSVSVDGDYYEASAKMTEMNTCT